MAGPPFPPPPSGPPPGSAWPPPPGSRTPPPAWGQAPDQYPYGQPPHRRTEPFAIVSLVASLAGFAFCGVGQVVGIVFGHIARSRIKRSGDDGAGLALAGIIVGYVVIALGVVAIVVVVLVGSHVHDDASGSARRLVHQIRIVAQRQGTTPRSGDVVREAMREAGFTFDDVYVGSSGQTAAGATDGDFAFEGWQLEVHGGYRAEACFVVPAQVAGTVRIRSGRCGPAVDL